MTHRSPPRARGLALALVLSLCACKPAEPPSYAETLEVEGSPYDMGFAQGQAFSSKIRSMYTEMLVNSILPALNRERPDIATILVEYEDPIYDDNFALQILLEAAEVLSDEIPDKYLEEMQGIADGAGIPFDTVLIVNTFIDSVLAVRTMQKYLQLAQAPNLTVFEIPELASDGADNDGDGNTDEAMEGRADPYDPSDHALFVQVPTDASLRMVLTDPDGVDPAALRLEIEGIVYTGSDPEIVTTPIGPAGEEATELEVVLTPRGGLPAASETVLSVEAGDQSLVTAPPPAHARYMRDQWIALSTEGLAGAPHTFQNRARFDDRFPASSIGVAVRGSATPDGQIRLAHHFALLDAGQAHKHNAFVVRRPTDGMATAMIGWTGLIWGTSGMNEDGLVWATNHSDSLDNPMTRELQTKLIAARLLAGGRVIGLIGREVLEDESTVADAIPHIGSLPPTTGWNHLIADTTGEMQVVETDSNISGDADGGQFPYGSDALDTYGQRLASQTDDDLYMGIHFQQNREDFRARVFTYELVPQRFWSGGWHRGLRTFYTLGDAVKAGTGTFDEPGLEALLRTDGVVDTRDSMNAAIYEPEKMLIHRAHGQVPATDGEFETYDFGAYLSGGGQ